MLLDRIQQKLGGNWDMIELSSFLNLDRGHTFATPCTWIVELHEGCTSNCGIKKHPEHSTLQMNIYWQKTKIRVETIALTLHKRAHIDIFTLKALQILFQKLYKQYSPWNCTDLSNTSGSTRSSEVPHTSPKSKLRSFQIETALEIPTEQRPLSSK